MVYYEESGKNAIVTGAERGIGKGIALRLAQAGYNVFFTYYFKDSYAEELKRSIEKLGRRCVALKADFRDPSVVETVVKSAAKSLGGIDLRFLEEQCLHLWRQSWEPGFLCGLSRKSVLKMWCWCRWSELCLEM